MYGLAEVQPGRLVDETFLHNINSTGSFDPPVGS